MNKHGYEMMKNKAIIFFARRGMLEDFIIKNEVLCYESLDYCSKCSNILGLSNPVPIDYNQKHCIYRYEGKYVAVLHINPKICKNCFIEQYGIEADEDVVNVFMRVYSYCLNSLKIRGKYELQIVESKTQAGAFIPGRRTIQINIVLFNENNVERIVKTVAHELRHAQQKEQNPDILKDYISFYKNRDGYKQHPAEMDADEYANKVFRLYQRGLL